MQSAPQAYHATRSVIAANREGSMEVRRGGQLGYRAKCAVGAGGGCERDTLPCTWRVEARTFANGEAGCWVVAGELGAGATGGVALGKRDLAGGGMRGFGDIGFEVDWRDGRRV